jgi:protein-S-isoprenylcysteine O-methyltransferase Ste14
VAAYGALHSLLASKLAKQVAARRFGPAAARLYRLGYNLIGLVSLLPLLALPLLLPDQSLYVIPFPWVLLTLGIQLAALAIVLLAVGQTDVWEFLGVRQLLGGGALGSRPLVETGLYRWVRHPAYAAGLLFIWLLPRMSMNLLALNVGLTAYLWLGSRLEERKLVEEFGPVYRAYQCRVPGLFPRPWHNRRSDQG